jgi:hypothetical protein
MKKLLIVLGLVLSLQGCKESINSGCDQYASKFSCSYVEKEATYKVYYWKDVFKNNENDNQFVGMATGLSQCRDTAIYAHRSEMEYRKRNWNSWSESDDNWSERSYICMLTKDGKDLEKHRY